MFLSIISIISIGIGVFLIFKAQNFNKEINTKQKLLADEIQHEKFLLNMTKVSCCDLCMEDHVSWRISAKEANEPVVIIHAGFRQFRLCEKHAKRLAETLSNGKADDYIEYIN